MSVTNVCRLCGNYSLNVVKVFTDQPIKRRTDVGNMMLDCLFTTVEPDDGYPEEVCQFCHLQLNVFFEFKKKVLEQHVKFTSLLPVRAALVAAEKQHKNEQESVRLQKNFKQEPSLDGFDSEESLLRIMEDPDDNAVSIRMEEDVADELLSHDVKENKSDDEISQIEQQEQDDQEAEEVDAADDNEFEEEQYLDEEELTTEYANDDDQVDLLDYQPQSFELEFFKSLDQSSKVTPKQRRKKFKYEDPDQDIDGMEIEFIDETEELESDDEKTDLITDITMNTPKKTMRIVGNLKKIAYKCRQCTKIFPTLAKFMQHVKTHQPKEKCKECNVMVIGEYMPKHMEKHSANKPFQCQKCGKGFSTQVQCASHEYRHLNLRPFSCTLCDKSFKLGCDLRIHMNCHNDVRKYECEICGKLFRMHSHLANHRETHATENTLECEACGLLFKTTVTLKSHVRQLHTQDHAYKCMVCNRGFYRKNKMLRHEQSHLKKANKAKERADCNVEVSPTE